MEEIKHVREFREGDVAFLSDRVMLLASGFTLDDSDQERNMEFQTIDVAAVISAILIMTEEKTGEGFADSVLDLLSMSNKAIKRSVKL